MLDSSILEKNHQSFENCFLNFRLRLFYIANCVLHKETEVKVRKKEKNNRKRIQLQVKPCNEG